MDFSTLEINNLTGVYKSYDESELILLLKSGNQAAFAEIYNRYWTILIDTAYQRLKSIEAAEEIVQDVFVSFFLRREQIFLNSTLEAYLKTALKYKVYNVYRSQQVHLSHLDAIIKDQKIDPLTPDSVLEIKELQARVRQVADKMPEKCRQVFLLSRFEHLSQQEIADQMGISISTVKKHMTKSLDIMRKEFNEHKTDLLAICMFIYLSRK
jgi:RNA polymerase sigma-70 factor (family 1)